MPTHMSFLWLARRAVRLSKARQREETELRSIGRRHDTREAKREQQRQKQELDFQMAAVERAIENAKAIERGENPYDATKPPMQYPVGSLESYIHIDTKQRNH